MILKRKIDVNTKSINYIIFIKYDININSFKYICLILQT